MSAERAHRSGLRCLVTGATGFIGSHLVEALVAGGATVTALARSAAKARRLPAAVAVLPGDLHDLPALQRAAAGQDVVFHLAGLVAAQNEDAFLRTNRDGTRNLVRATEAAGRPRFVLVSSLAAAGPNARGVPRDAAAPDRPITAYGRSKLAGEAVVRASALPWTILRPPVVYGPGDTALLPAFRLARRGFAPLFGDGAQELCAIYAPDLAAAALAVMTSQAAVGRTHYPCHAERFTTAAFARAIAHAVGCDVRLVRLPPWLVRLALTATGAAAAVAGRTTLLNGDKAAEFLAPAWTADPAPLDRDTGWIAATGLRAGLSATARAYRERGWLA